MTTSTKSIWTPPQRPIRACLFAFAALSAIVVITTPFMQEVPRLTYLFGGIAYSACLAVGTVGVVLLGSRIAKLLLFSSVAVSSGSLLAMMLPLVLLRERGLGVLGWVLPVARLLIWLVLAAWTVASLSGWVRHYRGTH